MRIHGSHPRHHRAVAVAVATLASFGVLPSPPSSATGGPTTTISAVSQTRLPSGGSALLGYTVDHAAQGPVPAGAPLPGVVIHQDDHPAAFDGMWGDAGQIAAWLSPQGASQLSPSSSMIENVYHTASLHPAAHPLSAGDHIGTAVAKVPWDAPLAWDRARGPADGALGWDAATDARTVASSFSGVTGEMEVLFVRADVVARGGDVDARAEAEQTPPLVLDLPRTYAAQPLGTYVFGVASPYADYLEDTSIRVVPSIGKAVITATVRGYLPEATEHRTAAGASIKGWHLPLVGAIVLSAVDDPVQPQLALDLAAGGTILTGSGDRHERRTVAPRERLTVAGHALSLSKENIDRTGASTRVHAADTGWLVDEIEAASAIDHTLAHSVDLSLGNGAFDVGIDPDWRGSGMLAVSPARGPTGTPYAKNFAVPFAVVDGRAISLDRDRLTDLRVFPQVRVLTLNATFAGGSTALTKIRTLSVSAHRPGLVIEAAYDLGEDLVAFVTMSGFPDAASPGSVRVLVSVRSLHGHPVDALTIQHAELPAGAVLHGATEQHAEFSAPLDSNTDLDTLSVGGREVIGSVLRSNQQGKVTVLRAPAAVSAFPEPDPSRSLAGAPVTVLYAHEQGMPPAATKLNSLRVSLDTDGEPPTANPRPIGEPCGPSQVVDDGAIEPAAPIDVQEAWLDADDANIYATLRLGERPAAAPEGTTLSWSVHWRYEHVTRFARASLDDRGGWSFDTGTYGATATSIGAVSGESTGTGLVRIAVPRTWLGNRDGELLRDVGAFSWITAAGTQALVDQAPQGAHPRTPHGEDYEVGRCASR